MHCSTVQDVLTNPPSCADHDASQCKHILLSCIVDLAPCSTHREVEGSMSRLECVEVKAWFEWRQGKEHPESHLSPAGDLCFWGAGRVVLGGEALHMKAHGNWVLCEAAHRPSGLVGMLWISTVPALSWCQSASSPNTQVASRAWLLCTREACSP